MAARSANPFEVTDFSAGITDDVFEQAYNTYATLDNFILTSDGKPASRDGSVIDNDTPANDQIPAGVQRIGTLINYANNTTLFVHSAKAFYYRNPAAYATLTGPTGNSVLSTGTVTNALSYTQWNRHIFLTSDAFPRPQKIYRDSGGVYRVRTSGLPALASDPTVVIGTAETNDYLYAFHYHYTYMVGDQEHQDFGATTVIEVDDSSDPGTSPNTINSIPVISNGVIDNWDTTVIKVFIYRTIAGGSTLYKIGEVTNGTTTFNDTFADTAIVDNDIIYTDDGTLDFDPTPESKLVHVVNSTGYYGYIKDGSEQFPNKVRQSVPGDPDACPEDFETELEDELVGLSSAKSNPIFLCKKHIYRCEGAFDQFGRGGMNPIRISDTAGCVSNLSIVQAENGVFWAGNDGFYYTDGYQTIKISDNINTRYKNLLGEQTQRNRIYGKFDELNRRILWGIQSDSGSLDNDSSIVLDLRWGIKPKSVFTTWSGNSFMPTAFEFFNDSLYRADTRGYVFIHDSDTLTDPKIDTAADAEDWNRETIIWTYQSININFGGTFFRKIPTRILLTAANRADTTIQISAINDDGKMTRNLNVIRWRRNFTWGDQSFVWGNEDCVWNATGLIEQWRRFPARGLRVSYVQMVITNGFSAITNSDTDGNATFNGAANTATLDNVTLAWPEDAVDYFIYTEADDYTQGFLITTRNSDTVVTVTDPNNVLPNGSLQWVIRGFKKGEPLNLLAYNIHWQDISQTQETFETGSSGENQ